MKPSDRLQAIDPLPDAHRDLWGEAVDVLVEALRIRTCECERWRETLPLAEHSAGCYYRVAMERAGLG